MKVVSDTSPLYYLLLIDQASLLPALFGHIIIPSAVEAELLHSASDERVRHQIRQRPEWLEVRPLHGTIGQSTELAKLDPGERAAILLAAQLSADLLIVDEKRARRVARSRGHRVTGLLGVLVQGAEHGLLDFGEAMEQLRLTSFRLDPRLVDLVRPRLS